MRYTLLIKKQAKKALQSLARTDRNRIAEKITLLGENPDNPILQIIKSIEGKAEYVLLPFHIYNTLRSEIEEALKKKCSGEDYVPFELTDYVDNPVALARINAGITQEELAKRIDVTQAYISKLEAQSKVTAKVLKKVKAAIDDNKK